MKSKFFSFLLSFVFIIGCKYPDGPLISFRSMHERIQGQWNLSAYIVNGIDSTEFYNNYFGNQCMFHFQKPPEDYLPPFGITWGLDTSKEFHISSYYSFISNNEISFGGGYSLNTAKFVSALSDPSFSHYKILKLEYKEVWLSANDYGNSYEMHLKNIEKY